MQSALNWLQCVLLEDAYVNAHGEITHKSGNKIERNKDIMSISSTEIIFGITILESLTVPDNESYKASITDVSNDSFALSEGSNENSSSVNIEVVNDCNSMSFWERLFMLH